MFTEFKGVLAEQYTLQQLVVSSIPLYYWNPENAESEVDFVMPIHGNLIPLEVKAGDNVRSRSLSVYAKAYAPDICLRTSLLPYRKQEWMENLPLYGIAGWLRSTEDSTE